MTPSAISGAVSVALDVVIWKNTLFCLFFKFCFRFYSVLILCLRTEGKMPTSVLQISGPSLQMLADRRSWTDLPSSPLTARLWVSLKKGQLGVSLSSLLFASFHLGEWWKKFCNFPPQLHSDECMGYSNIWYHFPGKSLLFLPFICLFTFAGLVYFNYACANSFCWMSCSHAGL